MTMLKSIKSLRKYAITKSNGLILMPKTIKSHQEAIAYVAEQELAESYRELSEDALDLALSDWVKDRFIIHAVIRRVTNDCKMVVEFYVVEHNHFVPVTSLIAQKLEYQRITLQHHSGMVIPTEGFVGTNEALINKIMSKLSLELNGGGEFYHCVII